MEEAQKAGLADVVTYNTMIKAYLQAGDATAAKKTMEAMRAAGHQPNCVTFNELIDATIRCDPDTAWSFVSEMKDCGLCPNHVTCSILLKSIQRSSRANDLLRALQILDTMEESMDEVLLSSVCEACIRANRPDLLTDQLKRQSGPKPVQVNGAHTFGSLIRAYGFVNDVDGVWHSWRLMRSRSICPTSITLGCMVEAIVSNGQIEKGYSLIREAMADPDMRPLVNAVIYCSVLKGFSHEKRFDRVWAVYEEMIAEKIQFSVVTFNTLIDASTRSGEMFRIQPLLQDMSKQGIEPNVITYSTILKGYCQENCLDKAFELMAEMKKVALLTPDEVTYNTLLDGCARHGLYDRGISVLKDMEASGVRPSNFTLSVVAKLATRSKRPEKAIELCDGLARKHRISLNIHVYNNLIHSCFAQSDLPKALGVFERTLREKVRPDPRTYHLLLKGAVSAGAIDDAVLLLKSATGLPGGHPRALPAAMAQLRGALSALQNDVVTEVLEALARCRSKERQTMELVAELRKLPGFHLPARLRTLISSNAIRSA